MTRCDGFRPHEPHDWMYRGQLRHCDGRADNEALVGQLTVGELRTLLKGEQDWALVSIRVGSIAYPVRQSAGRQKGRPVFLLEAWSAEQQ